jgi:hypothetical protein
MTTEENQMEWINVAKRVPDDRRRVLAWGEAGFCIGGYQPLRAQFLGETAFNPSPSGGRFDIESYKRFSVCHVTHWAELEGPNEEGLV